MKRTAKKIARRILTGRWERKRSKKPTRVERYVLGDRDNFRRNLTRDEVLRVSRPGIINFGKPKCVNITCRSSKNLQIDHRVPLSMGGDNNIRNLRILCKPCNLRRRKGRRRRI